jgi:hypothetical protein
MEKVTVEPLSKQQFARVVRKGLAKMRGQASIAHIARATKTPVPVLLASAAEHHELIQATRGVWALTKAGMEASK